MDKKFQNYNKKLDESHDTTQNLLTAIRQLKSKTKRSQPTQDDINELHQLQKEMIMDSYELTMSKDEVKLAISQLHDSLVSKTKTFNGVKKFNQLKYAKYGRELMHHHQNYEKLNNLLSEIPDFKYLKSITTSEKENAAAAVVSSTTTPAVSVPNVPTGPAASTKPIGDEDSTEKMIAKLTMSKELIKHMIIHDATQQPPHNDESKKHGKGNNKESQSIIQFSFTEQDINKLQNRMKSTDNIKFKLVQLNDKYYESKVNSLQLMKSKWDSNLARMKNFVRQDADNFKNSVLGPVYGELEKERERKRIKLNNGGVGVAGDLKDIDDHNDESDSSSMSSDDENDDGIEDNEGDDDDGDDDVDMQDVDEGSDHEGDQHEHEGDQDELDHDGNQHEHEDDQDELDHDGDQQGEHNHEEGEQQDYSDHEESKKGEDQEDESKVPEGDNDQPETGNQEDSDAKSVEATETEGNHENEHNDGQSEEHEKGENEDEDDVDVDVDAENVDDSSSEKSDSMEIIEE
ncbi:unnamed protein product [Ambrosiozyma monospora]|uniref:Unnamed protein product n=1 Tax=Ambrosiozyma monospora TaxID=43982 RepID=A0A9W6YWG4_AMBMO|nr:unnamed protein product [Ambrosiozyma monospora]